MNEITAARAKDADSASARRVRAARLGKIGEEPRCFMSSCSKGGGFRPNLQGLLVARARPPPASPRQRADWPSDDAVWRPGTGLAGPILGPALRNETNETRCPCLLGSV